MFFKPRVLLCAYLKVQSSNWSSNVLRSSSVHRSSSDLFFVKSFFLFFFRSAFNRPIETPTFFVLRSSSIYHSSSLFLFFVKSFFLFFFKSVFLQVPKSSLRDSVLLFRTRVYKTQDLSSIIFPTHQVGIESLILEFYN